MSATLIIIDMQKAMDDPVYGRRGQPDAEANMVRLLAHWRSLGNPVVHVKNDSMNPDSPYAPDKPTNDFKPEFAPADGEAVVDKRTHNAFISTDLMQVLEQYGSAELVICGVHLEQCVESTVRMAGDLGFMVFLPADCVIALDHLDRDGKKWSAEEVHALTLGILDGTFAKVLNSEDLMAMPSNQTLQ